MVQEWGALTPYAFPPFILIGRVLLKMKQDQVLEACLISPLWRAQPWFPLVLEMSINFPVLILMEEDTLTDPDQNPHPLVRSGRIQLVAWRVSGILSKAKEFQRRLQASFSHHGGKEQRQVTLLHGASGTAGVIKGIMIPFQHL